jgi:hypothetical protein
MPSPALQAFRPISAWFARAIAKASKPQDEVRVSAVLPGSCRVIAPGMWVVLVW